MFRRLRCVVVGESKSAASVAKRLVAAPSPNSKIRGWLCESAAAPSTKNMVGFGPGSIARTVGHEDASHPSVRLPSAVFSVRASAADGSLSVISLKFGHSQRAVASVNKEGLATHIP